MANTYQAIRQTRSCLDALARREVAVATQQQPEAVSDEGDPAAERGTEVGYANLQGGA